MTLVKRIAIVIAALLILLALAGVFFAQVINPAVMNDLRTNPNGEEAQRAMLITYSDKTLPVNYLKEGDTVYMAIDGRWWRDFRTEQAVTLLIKGTTYEGKGIVVLDDPDLCGRCFFPSQADSTRVAAGLVKRSIGGDQSYP